MDIGKVIEILKNEKECIKRADVCDRKCDKCELVMNSDEILDAYETAILTLSKFCDDYK